MRFKTERVTTSASHQRLPWWYAVVDTEGFIQPHEGPGTVVALCPSNDYAKYVCDRLNIVVTTEVHG